MRFPILALLIALTTSSCALYPESRQENSGSSHVSRPQKTYPANRQPVADTTINLENPRTSTNSGVATLLQQASQARTAGDLARAQSLAERAQTIEPRQGHSYLELARIYEAKGDNNRARQMALRGLSYAGEDRALKQSLLQLSHP